MGSVTPVYALPYPVGTDLITDGDNAMQALAQRVETVLLPTVSALVLGGGWSNYGDPYAPAVCTRFSGGLCVITGLMKATAATPAVATLPVNMRPAKDLLYIAYGSKGGPQMQRIDVAAAGGILVSGAAGAYDFVSLSGITYYAATPTAGTRPGEETDPPAQPKGESDD